MVSCKVWKCFKNDNNTRPRLASILKEQLGSRSEKEGKRMRRKPDLIWILVLVFSFGVVTTGYTQSYFDRSAEPVTNLQQASE